MIRTYICGSCIRQTNTLYKATNSLQNVIQVLWVSFDVGEQSGQAVRAITSYTRHITS